LILLASVTQAQVNGLQHGAGQIWSDSLYYGTPGDSTRVYDMRFAHLWYKIILEGDANSPVDSLAARVGSIRFDNTGAVVDTVWGNQVALKDSTWSDVNTMINNTAGTHYFFFDPIINLLELRLLNLRSTVVTRSVSFSIQAR